MEKKESHAVTSKFSFKTKRTEGGLDLGEKKCLSLKEIQAKEYPFFDFDIPRMFEELLKAKLIELPEPKRHEEANRSMEKDCCKYHNKIMGHPIEKCFIFKEKRSASYSSKLESGKAWADYSSDSDHESCHVCTEIKEDSAMAEDQEAPKATLSNPQSFAVTFTDEDLPEEDVDHNRLLYVSGYICERKISRMLVDGGLAVNILPLQTLKLLGISGD
ncbi:hypothetical protein LIER_20540 [Lithospermum erythrorhizon]|uniref:Retrotransposon gag protein n=1 Tax=Lithospermum erythrorhizon TaxID=34254 RepID=A0AAV3QLW7_LITER